MECNTGQSFCHYTFLSYFSVLNIYNLHLSKFLKPFITAFFSLCSTESSCFLHLFFISFYCFVRHGGKSYNSRFCFVRFVSQCCCFRKIQACPIYLFVTLTPQAAKTLIIISSLFTFFQVRRKLHNFLSKTQCKIFLTLRFALFP